MIVWRVIVFLIWKILVNSHYSLYHSNVNQIFSPAYDCLYAYFIDQDPTSGKFYNLNSQLVPYCRRPDDDVDDEKQENVPYKNGENIAKIISFNDLKKQGVSSEDLLSWSAPIDIVEKYEMMNEISSEVFYNCSSPWFGSLCQYKFNHNSSLAINDIIEATFVWYKYNIHDMMIGTCYRFLPNCNNQSWPMCLDWRQICDGLNDCINGEDEQWCEQLEITKCDKNEYRCHYGGQCIPLTFNQDHNRNIDCLDGTDVEETINIWLNKNSYCWSKSTFQCQEVTSRYTNTFQCGDGQYLDSINIPHAQTYCNNLKDREFVRVMLTTMDHISDMNCRKAFYCALRFRETYDEGLSEPTIGPHEMLMSEVYWNTVCEPLSHSTMNEKSIPVIENCQPLSKHCTSRWLVIPARPVLLNFFQLVYLTNRSMDTFQNNIAPDFVCFNAQQCPGLVANIVPISLINGLTCCHLSNLTTITVVQDIYAVIADVLSVAREMCLKMDNKPSCQNSSYFYCNKSRKCISKYRVRDGRHDCFHGEDELVSICQWNDSNRFQHPSDLKNCLSPVDLSDEVSSYKHNKPMLISFGELCDVAESFGFGDLHEGTETDETNCDWWPCANPYTLCDHDFQCLDGSDELNCSNSICSFNEYECQVRPMGSIHCISRDYLYDKYLDPCPDTSLTREIYFYNGTSNISEYYLSWKNVQCLTVDKFCLKDHDFPPRLNEDICSTPPLTPAFIYERDVKHYETNEGFCRLAGYHFPSDTYVLSSKQFGYYPAVSMNLSIQSISKINQSTQITIPIDQKFEISCFREFGLYCGRGILVLHGRNQTKECFCPPNYFGHRCQWQSERISLTLQFLWRSSGSSSIVFQVIVMLIDQDGYITPYHEQIFHVPIRDCTSKYNLYLLYPHRPKSLSTNYSIRMDLYQRNRLIYWGSWHLSIPFLFLPVNRIATQLIIPQEPDYQPCTLLCGQHGRCMRYINKKSSFFCQCERGYSGAHCNISHTCNCANDSICLSPSICVCPVYKFGPYCYVNHPICHLLNNPCKHNGICIPYDDRISLRKYTCLCSEEYSGKNCEYRSTRIVVQLNKILIVDASFIFINMITAYEKSAHQRTILLKKIPFDQTSVTIYTASLFNLLFVQIPEGDHYLSVIRENHLPSEEISTEVQLIDRCYHLRELLNKTFLDYEPLRRWKYYPFLCRKYSQMKCFRDDDANLLCICDVDRFSNCFTFNFTEKNDCQGDNRCENNGQCFDDDQLCPTKFTCICKDCYYGERCQYSTSSYMFSLDPILGYHIKPHVSINRQPFIIQISLTIITIMLIVGLLNGCLSIMTFGRKKPRELGSGNYLCISTISSIVMIILLTYKFGVLLLSQISPMTNRTFLQLNCILLDFMLKVLLATSEWLNACVAIERASTVKQSTSFNKKKSKELSKWVITSVIVLVILTHIHDPLHRGLVDDIDIDQARTWCLVTYSSSLNIYNSFITLFHFLLPFSINFLCAIWLIISLARSRAGVQHNQSYRQHLKDQIDQHRHLLIAPALLILLSLPRLIISFISGCMRSARQPWIHLIGYFLSFIPSMLTFIVFVLPSESYTGEFHATIREIKKKIRAIFSYG